MSSIGSIERLRSNKCTYCSEAGPHQVSSCALDILGDDVFEALDGHLPSESVLSLYSAYFMGHYRILPHPSALSSFLRHSFQRLYPRRQPRRLIAPERNISRLILTGSTWRHSITIRSVRPCNHFLLSAFNCPHFLHA